MFSEKTLARINFYAATLFTVVGVAIFIGGIFIFFHNQTNVNIALGALLFSGVTLYRSMQWRREAKILFREMVDINFDHEKAREAG